MEDNINKRPYIYSEDVLSQMREYYSQLPERSRRHYAAVEAAKIGHGGVSYISAQLIVDRKTILRGKKELVSGLEVLPAGRQRMTGGGRKKNGRRK